MKKYLSCLFVFALAFNSFVIAQDSEEEATEISTVEALSLIHI